MELTDLITLILNAVLVPILAWAVSELTGYLKSKANNEALNKYFDLANDAVVTAVQETMQTFVSTMKKAGTWNEETAAEALRMAKLKAQEIMGAAAYKALVEIVGDVDAWLTSKVEAATLAVKQADAAVLITAESEGE